MAELETADFYLSAGTDPLTCDKMALFSDAAVKRTESDPSLVHALRGLAATNVTYTLNNSLPHDALDDSADLDEQGYPDRSVACPFPWFGLNLFRDRLSICS